MVRGKRLSQVLVFVCTLMLLLNGCTAKQPAAPQQTPQAGQANLDLMLAGKKVGSESIAVIGGGQSNKLWIIDAKYHKMLTTLDITGPKLDRTDPKLYPNIHDTHAIVFTKDFKTMYTADWFNYNEDSYVIALDPKTFKEIARIPTGRGSHHSALSPDDKYLYVANQHDTTVSVIDTKTFKKVKDLQVGKGPDYISPSMYWDGKAIDSPYLFVSVDGENKVAVIDWKKNEVVKSIPVEVTLHGVNLTPDGKYVWAALIGGKDVAVIDVQKLEVVKKITFEQGPIHIVFSPDGKYGYVTTMGNLLHKVDTSSYQIVWKVTGTTVPAHLGVSPDGKELWTLNHGMDPKRYPYLLGGQPVNGIQIFDTDNGELINEVPAEAMPHEIQFVPYSTFGTPAPPKAPEGAQVGKDIYDKNCAGCHGANGEGDMGPKLATAEWSDPQKVAQLVREGKGKSMPAFKDKLKAEEIDAVAKFVPSLKK
ncbi:MAG TPA: c-type cytochrome [Verrucomicrobiae bacterium]|nr:c-type cytochrome [Verrucomicrobiae bacterium]